MSKKERLARVPRVFRRSPQRRDKEAYDGGSPSWKKRGEHFIVDGMVKKRATIKAAPVRPAIAQPIDKHIYYYKIYPQFHLGANKPWATTHSKILLGLFRTDKEWRQASGSQAVQFADYRSPIANYCPTKDFITRKAFQARLWANDPGLPPTLILSRGKVIPLRPENQALWDANAPGKWYLKPSHEHGGMGIIILKSPQEAKKYMRYTTGIGPKGSNGERAGPSDYVLQQGVEPLLLWKGHKFDLRTWVLVTFNRGDFHYYLYRHSFIKVATRPYSVTSNDAYMNLTNLTYQGGHRGMVAKTISWSSLPFYQRTWESTKTLVTRLMNGLNGQWKDHDAVGYEIMGFDIIFDAQEQPHILELNRYLGFPNNRNAEKVYASIYQMMRDTLSLAVKPHIYKDVAPQAGDWELLAFTAPTPAVCAAEQRVLAIAQAKEKQLQKAAAAAAARARWAQKRAQKNKGKKNTTATTTATMTTAPAALSTTAPAVPKPVPLIVPSEVVVPVPPVVSISTPTADFKARPADGVDSSPSSSLLPS